MTVRPKRRSDRRAAPQQHRCVPPPGAARPAGVDPFVFGRARARALAEFTPLRCFAFLTNIRYIRYIPCKTTQFMYTYTLVYLCTWLRVEVDRKTTQFFVLFTWHQRIDSINLQYNSLTLQNISNKRKNTNYLQYASQINIKGNKSKTLKKNRVLYNGYEEEMSYRASNNLCFELWNKEPLSCKNFLKMDINLFRCLLEKFKSTIKSKNTFLETHYLHVQNWK